MRAALRNSSALSAKVLDGLGAVEVGHRSLLDAAIRSSFDDSLDLDKAMAAGHEQENRWDYLLGYQPSDEVVAVEPHSAKSDQIGTVIKKREAARAHLSSHLREGRTIGRWVWVASGKVQFAPHEGAMRRLDQNGITFAGRKILAKHLS